MSFCIPGHHDGAGGGEVGELPAHPAENQLEGLTGGGGQDPDHLLDLLTQAVKMDAPQLPVVNRHTHFLLRQRLAYENKIHYTYNNTLHTQTINYNTSHNYLCIFLQAIFLKKNSRR